MDEPLIVPDIKQADLNELIFLACLYPVESSKYFTEAVLGSYYNLFVKGCLKTNKSEGVSGNNSQLGVIVAMKSERPELYNNLLPWITPTKKQLLWRKYWSYYYREIKKNEYPLSMEEFEKIHS